MVQYRKEYALKQIDRFFLHIRSFMENSEVHGVGDFMFNNRLLYGKVISIRINNHISWGPGCHTNKANPTVFLIQTQLGNTIWNIKTYIGKKLGVDPVLIKLEKIFLVSKDIKDSENAKTLHELDVRDGDKFKITTKMVSTMLDHMNFMFSDKTLTPEADRMFTEVFNMFVNEDGVMTKSTACKFLQYCCNQQTEETDPRIIKLFDDYSDSETKVITQEGFKKFYCDSIIKKETTVWGNVRAWHYKQDFKKGTNRAPREPNTLLRYLLPRKKEFFSYFVGLLKERYSLAKYSWELISRLAVDPDLYLKVAKLETTDENGNPKDFKFEELVDVNNQFELMHLLSLFLYYMGGGKSAQASVHVVYNMEEVENEELLDALNEDIGVKGTSVGIGTSSVTDVDVPAPIPAIPVGVSAPKKGVVPNHIIPSKSGSGKATNVTSAATQGKVPMAPPLPYGATGAGADNMTFNSTSDNESTSRNNVHFTDPEVQNEDLMEDIDQENVKSYPPGGVPVYSEDIDTESNNLLNGNAVDSESKSKPESKAETKIYKNYKDYMDMPHQVFENHDFETSNEEWVLKFIQLGGFEFLFNLFTSEDTLFSKAISDIDMLSPEEKECVGNVLEMLRLIMGTAQIANDKDFSPKLEIIKTEKVKSKELPKVDEDAEMNDEAYEIDEALLLESVGNSEPTRQRTISTVAKEENDKEIEDVKKLHYDYCTAKGPSLLKILTGEYGEQILKQFPYDIFIKKSIKIIATMLVRRATTSVDEMIMEKLLDVNLFMFLQNHDLIDHLYNFNEDVKLQSSFFKIDFKEFLIRGVTFSTHAKTKALFTMFMVVLCKIKHTNSTRLPIIYILEIFKTHFLDTIKNQSRYYGYQEFYQFFCQLISMYFELKEKRNKQFENILEPSIFLKQLTSILKDYKSKEKRNTVLEDHCLIGIFDVIEQILKDRPEYLEKVALEQGLLHEVFFNCLFQETVEAPKVDITQNFDLNSTDLHTNK